MNTAGGKRSRILVVDDDAALRHALQQLLRAAGHVVTTAKDGVEALEQCQARAPDLVLLDIGLPRLSGLEVLSRLRGRPDPPLVVVMTADDTSETLLTAVREQAYDYIAKPFPPNEIPEIVERALAAAATTVPIEVVSAKPEWVELVVPSVIEVADRIQGFMLKLEADLPAEVRDSVGQAFRELLLNAIEWGGRLDPNRKVRITYVRAKRMLLYRIADPGEGFSLEGLTHSAMSNPPDSPLAHTAVREEQGLRPGGFGLLMVRAMVDELIYNEARNEVIFIKYLD